MNHRDYFFAGIEDKIAITKKRNKIQATAFYTPQEIAKIEKHLKSLKENHFFFTGGFENAERKILMLYPDTITQEMAEKNIDKVLKAIHIKLPKEQFGSLEHRDYLSALMKLGLERERFGDIVVLEEEAFIMVLSENAEYVLNNLKLLTRFKKASLTSCSIDQVKPKDITFEEMRIVISSERLDNFVAELARTSRNGAEELILAERVLLNQEIETKLSKIVKEKDILTIRGKGKFIIASYEGQNKKLRKIYLVKKYH